MDSREPNDDLTRGDPATDAAVPGADAPTAQSEPLSGAARLRAWLSMFFVDHGFFRYAYLNLHRVGRRAFRSAQPGPTHVARYARLGIKTVVNLRGGDLQPQERLEREACAGHGLAYAHVKLRSRQPPSRETLEEVAALLDAIAYPAVFHCKAGADRAGLMSALYLILKEGASADEAARQLSLYYGHVRQGPTGELDAFIEAWAAEERAAQAEGRTPDFMAWARTAYDPEAVRAQARATIWGRILVDRLLGRE